MEIVVLICIIFVILSLSRSGQKGNSDNKIINDFENYQVVLNFFLDKAYDLIYKDRILVYSVEATSPTQDEFDTFSKDFCKLVIKLMGPNLEEKFIELYGNEETLLLNIAEFFNSKSEHDEIKEASINQLMNKDQLGEETNANIGSVSTPIASGT